MSDASTTHRPRLLTPTRFWFDAAHWEDEALAERARLLASRKPFDRFLVWLWGLRSG